MDCGTLKKGEKDGQPYYMGWIDLPAFAGNVCFVPNARARGQAPDFKAKVKTEKGWKDIDGGIWLKPSDKVAGGQFLSITVDMQGMDKPLYVTGFPADHEDGEGPVTDYKVVWSRAKPGKPKGAKVAAVDKTAPLDDDGVPF